MRQVKVLIKQHTSSDTGAIGEFWFPEVEIWNPKTGELNIIVKLYVSQSTFEDGLHSIGNKYFKINVSDWDGEDIEQYAFDYIEEDIFFQDATKQIIEIN